MKISAAALCLAPCALSEQHRVPTIAYEVRIRTLPDVVGKPGLITLDKAEHSADTARRRRWLF